MRSINVVAVKLVDKIGLNTSIQYAEKFGIPIDQHDRSSIASLSLGELHKGTNPLIMAQATVYLAIMEPTQKQSYIQK